MARVSVFLIMVALIAGLAGCGEVTPAAQYELTMAVAPAGSGNATDLTNASPYTAGTAVNITAVAAAGYQFVNWTAPGGAFANANATQTTFTMPAQHVTVTACFGLKAAEIRTWYDLDAMRHNLAGRYLLMNDLDSTVAGYDELASEIANQGKGWEPVGTSNDQFTGAFDGQGYEIRDLFVSRPDEDGGGLFGFLDVAGVVEDVGLVNAEVTGHDYVGGVVGWNYGTVNESYSTGNLSGRKQVGGLVAVNGWLEDSIGIVSDCYSTASVAGESGVGGLVGWNYGTVSDSYSSGSLTGEWIAGGLLAVNSGTVINSYSTGSVTGGGAVGGLVGVNGFYYGRLGTVSNSYYSYNEVLINGQNIITTGALFNEDFEQWLANDKFLDVKQRLSQEDGYYTVNDVSDFKELLAFGQDGSLRFRLESDLDLGNEPDFYIPYLAGEFDGNGHRIANLSFSFGFIAHVGLFGYVASGGVVTGVSAENVNINGRLVVGGLVGQNYGGTVSDSYSTGSVTGWANVGGLVGRSNGTVSNSYSAARVTCEYTVAGGLLGTNRGTVSNSYSTGSVTGGGSVGGLLGLNSGTLSNSHYSYNGVLINGENVITVGALFSEDFVQWLANDKFLDVNERLSEEHGCYLINDVSDLKQLLAFGQDDSLRFRLMNDLDLSSEPNFYVPYLAGEFDGNGHKIWHLSFHSDFITGVGLFGYLGPDGKINEVGVENVDVTGSALVGGLVGSNGGTVSDSYSTGSVTGGLFVGGLVGINGPGTVTNSYSTGSVTGTQEVGGLVGGNEGTVGNSFWDTETSGQATSSGGTGKTTVEMKNITTFSGAGWNIIAVANPGTRNPSYAWNIVDGQTYPFLSWQP